MNEATFFDELDLLGISLSDYQKENLLKYLDLIIEYNSVMDLTANITKEEILEKNFYDSIRSLSDYNYQNKNLIDIGSGAGFPGILYAIINPSLKVTLLEVMKKRCDFLKIVVNKLNLSNVEIICERAEIYAKEKRESYDFVSARGVARLNILLELCVPFLKVKGIFIALKAKKAYEEEKEAKKALELLSLTRNKVVEFCLPTNNETRINLYYQKNKVTSLVYPRNYAKIKKLPL